MRNNIQNVSFSPRSDERLKKEIDDYLNFILVRMRQHTVMRSEYGTGGPQLVTDCMFHGQINDVPESEVDLRAEEKSAAERKSTHDISVKLREGPALMDVIPIPNLGEGCTLILLKAGESARSHLEVKKGGDAFSSANRNSGSRKDAGTPAEEAECL